MRILGLESSCDETAAAVVEERGRTLLSSVVASQVEISCTAAWCRRIASRAPREAVCGVTRARARKAGLTLADIDAVAVTVEPGTYRRAADGAVPSPRGGWPAQPASRWCRQYHIRGHRGQLPRTPAPCAAPFLALVVSGGDTS